MMRYLADSDVGANVINDPRKLSLQNIYEREKERQIYG